MVVRRRPKIEAEPEPQRWSIEVFGLEKRFAVRQGLPVGINFGDENWLVSSLLKYRKKAEVFQAVDGVDLKVARGEILGLLGPNGAGKTTLIKCLTTLLTIDRGEAFVNGFSARMQKDEVRLSANLVGSGHWIAFDWGLTIEQNLHFFGSLYGLSRAERRERIAYTLDLLGLTPLAHKTPRGLSSGERQRMLLAKGFMVRTPVFFLDEPTVGLDPNGATQVRSYIRNELIGKSDTSGILTTHRLGEAEALCSRIAIMNKGRIIAEGTPLELKKLAGRSVALEVRVTSLTEVALQEIKQMDGVRAAAARPVGEGSLEQSVRLHCDDVVEIQKRVVDLFTRRKIAVSLAEPQEPTLEDAFMALTDRRLN